MRVWHFTEQAYPHAWDLDTDSLRNTLPNRHFDPEIGAGIINRCLDEWVACDELGLDIMVNEHHSSSTSLSVSVLLTLGMLARQTKRARLLALGIPLANRNDPVRVAEEIAYVDCVSRGRLEVGFVKGAPYEIAATNSNPVRMMDRLWEAHDLILKAFTHRDGPFSWEGEYFHHRNVNIWPRPYQQPHPPLWITASGPDSGRKVADHGHVVATFLSGFSARKLFDAYRQRAIELGRPMPGPDRFAYNALVAVGRSVKQARERMHHLMGYLRTSPRVAAQFTNPPGYAAVEPNVAALRRGQIKGGVGAHFEVLTSDGRRLSPVTATVDDLIDAGVCFCGTPDDVASQIKKFNADVGGFGHLLMMGHAGWLDPESTLDNLTLMAREVVPQLAELGTSSAAA